MLYFNFFRILNQIAKTGQTWTCLQVRVETELQGCQKVSEAATRGWPKWQRHSSFVNARAGGDKAGSRTAAWVSGEAQTRVPPPTNHPLLLFTTVTESTGDNVCTACRGIGVKPPKSLALLSGITVVATGWENVKLWHSERQQKMRPESFEEALCLLYQLSIQIWTDERKTGRIIRHWIHLKWTHFLNLCKGWG